MDTGTLKMTRIFVTQEDIVELLGCKKSMAYRIVREINDCAKEKGNRPFPSGKANKYLFSDLYAIPIDEIDRVIEAGQEA